MCAFFKSIKWHHDFHCACSNPCDDRIVNYIMEGGKRILSKPILKKDPIQFEVLEKIIDLFEDRHKQL